MLNINKEKLMESLNEKISYLEIGTPRYLPRVACAEVQKSE